METADRVKQARQHFGLSQEKFGSLAGVTKAAVSAWERGASQPDRDALLSLQKKKRLNPDWLAYGRGVMFLAHDSHDDVLSVEVVTLAKALRELSDEQLKLAKALIEQLRLIKSSPTFEQPVIESEVIIQRRKVERRASIGVSTPHGLNLSSRKPSKKA